jgi:sialidase-1
MKKTIYSLGTFLLVCFLTTGFVYNQEHKNGKITTYGYWIAENVEEIPGLKSGPFIRLDDGDILTVENNMSLISRDEGKTWTEYPIFDDPEKFEIRVERVLIRSGNGVIILAFANNKERANWNWQESILDSPGAILPTYTVRSLDGGKTWQDLQKLHNEWTGANRDIIETRDGNIILSSMMFRSNPGRHTVVTYTSMTDGLNWIQSNVIDLGGIGHHGGVTEATIEQLNDGRIWMLIRTNWGVFWESYSENEGLTWKNFKPTIIDASTAPGILQRLKSGRLVLVWNRKNPEGRDDYPLTGGDGNSSEVPRSNHREELSIMFSDDDGITWSSPNVIARSNKDSKTRAIAYPRIFEASPGELWITTTYAGFGGYLSMKLYEKDFN